MKKIALTILIGGTLSCWAQEVERDVVSSSGDFYSNSSAQVSVTIGEVVTTTVSGGSNDLTQGFQQTKLSVVGLEDKESFFGLNIYPNPTTESVIVKLENVEEDLSLSLYTSRGKTLHSQPISDAETKLDFKEFAVGTYFIDLIKDGKPLKTYKVLKQ